MLWNPHNNLHCERITGISNMQTVQVEELKYRRPTMNLAPENLIGYH